MASPLTEKTEAISPSLSILGYFLFVIRLVAIALSLLITLVPHGIWRLFRLPSPWPRIFLLLVCFCCGGRVTTQGQRIKKDVFYAANHLSWIDIPVIAGQTGTAFIAQDGIASWPIIGWLCRINHTVFVSRTDRMRVNRQIEDIRAALDARYPITIFPEGTTTDGRSTLPFKPSLFAVVSPPPKEMQVQPVYLDYGKYGPEIAWVGDESALDNAKRLFARLTFFRVTLYFLDPINPADYKDRKEICTEIEARITAALSASHRGERIV